MNNIDRLKLHLTHFWFSYHQLVRGTTVGCGSQPGVWFLLTHAIVCGDVVLVEDGNRVWPAAGIIPKNVWVRTSFCSAVDARGDPALGSRLEGKTVWTVSPLVDALRYIDVFCLSRALISSHKFSRYSAIRTCQGYSSCGVCWLSQMKGCPHLCPGVKWVWITDWVQLALLCKLLII